MRFGTRKADAPARSESSGTWIKYFKKGEKTVRFLEQMDDWTKYYEHFNQNKMRAYPCTGDRDMCPGCTSDNVKEQNASCRFLVNLLDIDTGYVDLWKVPVSIIEDLERYEDKDDGDITKRHYTVIQFQSEGKTKYSVDKEERDSTPVSEYKDKFKDHEKALSDAYTEAWGQDPADEESPVQEPTKRPKSTERVTAKEEEPEEGDPPFEDEGEEIDEASIQKLDAEELKNLFRRTGLRVPRTDDVEVLREKLVAQIGV